MSIEFSQASKLCFRNASRNEEVALVVGSVGPEITSLSTPGVEKKGLNYLPGFSTAAIPHDMEDQRDPT